MASPTTNLRAIVNDDGAAVLDIERDSISTLNCTGAYVWQGLAQGETLEAIITNLAHDTGEDVLLVEHDVREFADALKKNHLLPR